MGRLSTHVLDTMHGSPARNMLIELFSIDDSESTLIKKFHTNHDGRSDAPLLEAERLKKGVYELVFHAGDYFASQGIELAEPRFIDQVTIRFGIANPSENYHVPLLVTPWAWSTYRGS